MVSLPGSKPEIFKIPFDNCTMDEALSNLDSLVLHARRDGHCRFAAFINAHCMNISTHDAAYADILRHADVVWPDGSGIRVAGRILGFTVAANVNGTDMFPLMCGRGHSIYMLGGAPGVADKAREKAQAAHADTSFVGSAHGYFADAAAEQAAIAAVNAVNPDILLVALGVPKQEKWIAAHRDELKCGVAIAVGGLLDFISERIPRAPLWMRRCGIEWMYRLYQEPVRLFRRYVIGNPLFVYRVWRSRKSAETA